MSEQRKNNSAPNASLSSTRQLLDELDVLMEKMLALPVGDAPGKAGLEKTQATSVLDAPAAETPVPAAEPEEEAETFAAERADDEEKPPTYSYEESNEPEEEERESQAGPTTPVPEHELETAPGNSFSMPGSQLSPVSSETLAALTNLSSKLANEQALQRSRQLVGKASPGARWWLWPLAVTNGAFDFFTYCLGPLGSWLRQPAGRSFLGWLGLALLLAAGSLQAILWLLQK